MRLIFPNNIRRPGFTLIELMVVLVLMAIMASMIIPEMKGTYENALLRSASRELVNVFSLAYSRAVSANTLHRVHLDRSGKYFVERQQRARKGDRGNNFVPVRDVGGEGEIDNRISIEIRTPDEDLSNAASNDQMSTDSENNLRDRDDSIAFYPDGTADASEILLRDREGFRLALRINPTTARVHIVEMERQ